MIKLDWKGRMSFDAVMPDGTGFRMDAGPNDGGDGSGASPVEALLASVAACSAMDVVSILRKKRMEPTSYFIEIEHERTPKGEYPRPVTSIVLHHKLKGENLDPEAVARAIELSDNKYCSVMATLKFGPALRSEFTIEEPAKI